ncbi:MAG: hypothetical protein LBU87_02725 [Lactobacillales bacterium]|jgi:hypothetical protein|nr:hypothetical protein [Lactobacillales bacterium]
MKDEIPLFVEIPRVILKVALSIALCVATLVWTFICTFVLGMSTDSGSMMGILIGVPIVFVPTIFILHLFSKWYYTAGVATILKYLLAGYAVVAILLCFM